MWRDFIITDEIDALHSTALTCWEEKSKNENDGFCHEYTFLLKSRIVRDACQPLEKS